MAAYQVIGAAAVVELNDGKDELNTGRKLYLEENGFLPEGVKQASIDHLLSVGLITEVDEVPPEEAPVDGDASKARRGTAVKDN